MLGHAALARALVIPGRTSPGWLSLAVLLAYAVAGAVSWPRAVLAALGPAWTVHHLRTRAIDASALSA